jgi:hypothetical protein
MAVSDDGSTLIAVDILHMLQAVHEFSVADGALVRRVGGFGAAPLQFNTPCQVCVAPDGFVFVTDYGNARVQVLTRHFAFHGFVGVGQLSKPMGVCANADVVVVTEPEEHRAMVFRRCDDVLLATITLHVDDDGHRVGMEALGLCFLHGGADIAVADHANDCVSVFSVGGEFIRHVGVGVLHGPETVACSPFDELVVPDRVARCVRLFSGDGDLFMSFGSGEFTCVALRGCTVIVADSLDERCVVFS